MSAKRIYYHLFRKARVEKGLPVRIPRPPGLHANEIRSRRGEKYVVKLFQPISSSVGGNWNVYQLNAGEINQPFSNYMKAESLHNACFISAWDPYENPYGDIPNEVNQNRLKEYLKEESLIHVEANTTGVNHLSWYSGERPCFVIFNISKNRSDHIADLFYQNTYVRIPNPLGYLKLEIRQSIHKPYETLKCLWLNSLKGMTNESARKLSLDSMAQIMAAPEKEELHWLLPELRDLNQPWPMTTPTGDHKGLGTEWERLSKLHKAATWEFLN